MNKILTLGLFLALTSSVFGGNYMATLRSSSDRSKDIFRINKSTKAIEALQEIDFPLLSAWIATSTPKLMTVTAANGCPAAVLTSATGVAYVNFPDAASGSLVYEAVLPAGYVTGSSCELVLVANSASNVTSPAYLSVQLGINGGALTAKTANKVDCSDGAYTAYTVDLSSVSGVSALVPGDLVSFVVSRFDLNSNATAPVLLKNVKYRFNTSFPHKE